jgi:hypothetical protein
LDNIPILSVATIVKSIQWLHIRFHGHILNILNDHKMKHFYAKDWRKQVIKKEEDNKKRRVGKLQLIEKQLIYLPNNIKAMSNLQDIF